MRKKLKYALSLISASVLSGCFSFNAMTAPTPTPIPYSSEETPIPEPVVESEPVGEYVFDDERIQTIRDELAADRAINSDVQAMLVFQNELVHQPVVKGSDNEHYLYSDWETGEYASYGSITMDYRNDLNADNMNLIIYGHYQYESRNADRTWVFTPLAQLMDEANYEPNKYVALILDNEIRYYEIVSVYDCPMEVIGGLTVTIEELQFNLIDYSEQYFGRYLAAVKEHEYYSTGKEVEYGNRLLTLQTCIEDKPESREIVLCREIVRVPIN